MISYEESASGAWDILLSNITNHWIVTELEKKLLAFSGLRYPIYSTLSHQRSCLIHQWWLKGDQQKTLLSDVPFQSKKLYTRREVQLCQTHLIPKLSETTISSGSLSKDVFYFLGKSGRKEKRKKFKLLSKMSTDRQFQSSFSQPRLAFIAVVKFPTVFIFIRAREDLERENTEGVCEQVTKVKTMKTPDEH